MITFIDLGPKPTVHLFLRVPVPLAGGGWSWGEQPTFPGALAKEFAYSAKECASLVHTYGRTITRVMNRAQVGDRFEIHAKGPVTGLTIGLREWEWSSELRDYKPVGEYMCGWRQAVKELYLRTGELIEDRSFSATAVPLPWCPDRIAMQEAA
jgi:hypothetical protein